MRLLAHHLDRRLLERTLKIAQSSPGAFNPRALRAALDSSPLAGAGRVEDTYNLLGHAVRKAIVTLADQQGRGLAACGRRPCGRRAGRRIELEAGLDCNWHDPAQREQALRQSLAMVEQATVYVAEQARRPTR